MASVTLAESAKLSRNMLVAGVIENVITVNKSFQFLPFDGVAGNALQYQRENALGDVTVGGVGDTFTSLGAGKAAATFTSVATGLTTIMGDAEVNGLIQSTRSSDGNDQTAIQVASKAKSCGRKFQDMMINGTGADNQFSGLLGLCAASQKATGVGADGSALSFTILDETLDLVTDKDGQADWIMMHARTIRSFRALLRALGGAGVNETLDMPGGGTVMAYNGIPVFRNDYIPINQTKGNGTALTTILAGTWDDGSRSHGVAGLTSEQDAGIQVVDVGEKEDADEHITRVKWYCSLALFSEKGLAAAVGITN